MAKKANATKKKRNKRYTGEDAAAPAQPKVTKVVATKKNPLQEFWEARKASILTSGAFGVLVLLVLVLVYAVFALITWLI